MCTLFKMNEIRLFVVDYISSIYISYILTLKEDYSNPLEILNTLEEESISGKKFKRFYTVAQILILT